MHRIYVSPLDRAQQTAQLLAADLKLPVHTADALQEVDFGDWNGKSLLEIERTGAWSQFNRFRSGTRAPGGELLLEIQNRVIGLMLQLRDEAPNETLLLVTHGDVIRAALAYFLGMPIDFIFRLQIDPASTSTVRVAEDSAEVLGMNC
jgi:probable phosphoglycerate mutase